MSTGTMTRRGFSLVEVAAVLAVLALMAGAVALYARPAVTRARAETVGERLAALDGRMRLRARSLGRTERLVVNLDHGTVRLETDAGSVRPSAADHVTLPDRVRLRQVRIAGDAAGGGAGGATAWSGRVTVGCSPAGATPTYALGLETKAGRRWWLLVAGLTGQVTEVDDATEIEALFAALPARRDAR